MTDAPPDPKAERPLSTAALAVIRRLAEVVAAQDHEEELRQHECGSRGTLGDEASGHRGDARRSVPARRPMAARQDRKTVGGKTG